MGAQKIDGLPQKIYSMASTRFLIQDSLGKIPFFEQTFLLANTSIKVVVEMPFLSFSNANVKFAELKRLTWRTYIIAKALSITSRVKLINKREFVKAALDVNFETFVVYITALEMPTAMPIYLLKTSQVQGLDKPTLAILQWDKACTKIPAEYADYADIFSSDLAIELLENMEINELAIKLIDRKQLPYGPIYAFSLVELEILKTYIKIHLKTGFIQPSKSPADALILFDKKFDGSLRLCVNY